ncbi:hypothetical protein BKA64DRAFT_72204 [Cadophora sp. MPI-SDFR-AT-0126]|nr:hypothetical protein BKA64DRAFT_72204 [Leotiomycetes sp. MPI-SDFR-AT-0126]
MTDEAEKVFQRRSSALSWGQLHKQYIALWLMLFCMIFHSGSCSKGFLFGNALKEAAMSLKAERSRNVSVSLVYCHDSSFIFRQFHFISTPTYKHRWIRRSHHGSASSEISKFSASFSLSFCPTRHIRTKIPSISSAMLKVQFPAAKADKYGPERNSSFGTDYLDESSVDSTTSLVRGTRSI